MEQSIVNWQSKDVESLVARFESGEYIHPPWANQPWAIMCNQDLIRDPDQFLFTRRSHDFSDQVEYLAPVDSIGRRKWVRVRPGRFLSRYYPQLNNVEIRKWSERFTAGSDLPELLFCSTPDGIVAIYENGEMVRAKDSSYPSCMRYKNSDVFHQPHHPTYVYGAGDLAVAYIQGDDGRTVARTMVWMEHKWYTRTYAESESLHRVIIDCLESRGFKEHEIIGSRLLKIDGKHQNSYLCPYIDVLAVDSQMVSWNDDEPFLYIGSKEDNGTDHDSEATSTGGMIEFEAARLCEHCGDEIEDDDCGTVNSELWCQECLDSDSFYCERCNRRYHMDQHNEVDGNSWCGRCCERHAFRCSHCKGYHRYEMTFVYHSDGTSEQWCYDCCDDTTSDCDRCGLTWVNDEITPVMTSEERTQQWCPRCINAAADECAVCGSICRLSLLRVVQSYPGHVEACICCCEDSPLIIWDDLNNPLLVPAGWEGTAIELLESWSNLANNAQLQLQLGESVAS